MQKEYNVEKYALSNDPKVPRGPLCKTTNDFIVATLLYHSPAKQSDILFGSLRATLLHHFRLKFRKLRGVDG